VRHHGGDDVPVDRAKKAPPTGYFENRLSSGDHAEARTSVKVRGKGVSDPRPRNEADSAAPPVLQKENVLLIRISGTKLHPQAADPFAATSFAVSHFPSRCGRSGHSSGRPKAVQL
jgi:hypothetical protein